MVGHDAEHLSVKDDNLECVPVTELDREVIPVLGGENLGQAGVRVLGERLQGRKVELECTIAITETATLLLNGPVDGRGSGARGGTDGRALGRQ